MKPTIRLMLAAGTAIALSTGAVAQSSDDATASGSATGAAPTDPSQITCAEFLVLDTPMQGDILMPMLPSQVGMSGGGAGTDDAQSTGVQGEEGSGPAAIMMKKRPEGRPESASGAADGGGESGSNASAAAQDGVGDDGHGNADVATGATASQASGGDGGTAAVGATEVAATHAGGGHMNERNATARRPLNATHMPMIVTGVFRACAERGDDTLQSAMEAASEEAQGAQQQDTN